MAAPPLTAESTGPAPVDSVASGAGPAIAPDTVADPPRPPARTPALLHRVRLLAVCLAFLGLSLSQAPGRVLNDTKLDLTADPWGFLGRALQLWEPEGFAGQVQNQAYGYLFPMGPFFGLGEAAGLPDWVVQRLWLALLMSTAFLGVVALARRLGVGTPGTALVAGVAYALAPRMVTAIGATSVEVVPMAVAPWVLVPLAGVTALRSPRRAAALSGLAVLCAGGVNAVAAAAVLPLPVLWLLTRPAGPLRRRLVAWWALAVGLATAWWAVPLLLLGRYSPPFLDYIETADVTTAPTDVLSVLRGTSHWFAALGSPAGPVWPAGWSLLTDTLPVAGTVVLAAAGLAALTGRCLPERTWLVLGVLAGVSLVTLGHLATVGGLFAEPLNAALDGPLAPLRNVHKFDPVLRLPLVLALAHLLARLADRARGAEPGPPPAPSRWRSAWPDSWTAAWPGEWPRSRAVLARAALAVLAVALVAGISPALAGKLPTATGFEEIPGYWQEAAGHLAAEQPAGRALLVPASSFGTYVWGSPQDEPMQPLADSPWDVRNAIPLTSEGHIRYLDALGRRLERGEGSEGLTRALARGGFSHVVLRNDLDAGSAGAARSVVVRQALRTSPGITLEASFGPDLPGLLLTSGLVLDAGLGEPAPAIEVYAVDGAAPRAWTAPLADAVTVAGGPDAVVDLEERGLVTGRPTVLAGAAPEGSGPALVTDALARRERAFGRLDDATSAALTPAERPRLGAPARDYPVAGPREAQSVVRYDGGTPAASSSASDVDNAGGAQVGASPFAAVDGDPVTAWRPAVQPGGAATAWWRLDTDQPFTAAGVTLVLDAATAADPPAEVRLVTDTGSISRPLQATVEPQDLPLPAGVTDTLVIGLDADPADPDGGPGLAEVVLPGVTVTRTVVTPVPDGPVEGWALAAYGPRGTASGCVVDGTGDPRCAGDLAAVAEEPATLDRAFTVAEPGRYDLAVTAVPRPGPALDALLAEAGGAGIAVTASSAAVPDPRGSALAAVDGDPATAWLAAPEDRDPTLVLTWEEPRVVDRLQVTVAPGLAATVPTAVTLTGGGLERTLGLDPDGSVAFTPITTDRLEVTFERPLDLDSWDPYTRRLRDLGVGVSELGVGGPATGLDTGAVVTVPCGDGPVVAVDGVERQTSAETTVGALRGLAPLDLTVCDGEAVVEPSAGRHRLVVTGTDTLAAGTATLLRSGSTAGEARERQAADVRRWDVEHRRVAVPARAEATLLVVPENTNPGWTATLDGEALPAVAVDGWQQGYVLPPGPAGTVALDFAPGSLYRGALVAGGAGVLLLAVLAAVPARRPAPRGPGRPTPRWLLAAGLVGGTVLVGGAVGLGLLALAALVAAAAGPRRPAVLAGLGTVPLAVAGVLLLTAPAATGTARQVLALLALAAVVAAALPPVPLPGRFSWAALRPRGPAAPESGA